MERVSRVKEDEVLPDWDQALILYQFSIAIFAQVFKRLTLLRGTPVCFR